jgi:hypothetical protein
MLKKTSIISEKYICVGTQLLAASVKSIIQFAQWTVILSLLYVKLY